MKTVLIAEGDKANRSLLSFTLTSAGFDTVEAADAITAIDLVSRTEPDIALLDWQLPDMEGLKLLRYWRADDVTAEMPIILLGERPTKQERVTGLSAGADDFVTKPFEREELVARIQAILRRAAPTRTRAKETTVKSVNGLQLDMRSLRVMANDQPVHLGPIEFRLLNLFMSHVDRALTRTQIVHKVWQVNAYVDERTVDVHVRRLRRALQPTGHDWMIQTVRGVGYRFALTRRASAT
ncbi:MAG: winged helix-turn-helix domain-containing protein [Gammaproteobacteria bacterium]|nr:winged helix-turn-helix domain-containing protein [Gammaproteobacteria bacterium]